jgi:hypothetical protein
VRFHSSELTPIKEILTKMPIIAKKEKSNFQPCPEGLFPAICCDVVDKGMQETQWGSKHKIQLRWLVAAKPQRDDKKPHMISKSYTLSLHEKANLRLMLEVWRGRKFTEQETEGFDIEQLIGAPCQIQVAQEASRQSGDVYAFPQVVLKAVKGAPLVPIGDYVRECNRPGYKSPEMPEAETQVDDDDPFGGALPSDEEETIPF